MPLLVDYVSGLTFTCASHPVGEPPLGFACLRSSPSKCSPKLIPVGLISAPRQNIDLSVR